MVDGVFVWWVVCLYSGWCVCIVVGVFVRGLVCLYDG